MNQGTMEAAKMYGLTFRQNLRSSNVTALNAQVCRSGSNKVAKCRNVRPYIFVLTLKYCANRGAGRELF
jgi:hypothetical protein